MTPRVDRVNRVVLVIAGGLLVIIGVLALLQSGGAFGPARADSPVVSGPTARWYRDNGEWLWPSAGVLGLVIAGLCVWWVSAQIRTRGSARIELDRAHEGTVTVAAGALCDCIELDALTQPGVARARAKIDNITEETRLYLTVWVEPPYDIADVIARVTTTVLAHFGDALEGRVPVRLHTTIRIEAAEAEVARLR